MTALASAFNDVVHLFFPHVCVGCGTDVLNLQHPLCLRCLSELPETAFFNQSDNPIEKAFFGRIPVKSAGSAFFFTKESLIQSIVYELKYKGNKSIGNFMGEKIGELLKDSGRFDDVDALIPLPLNAKRLKKRGYNQSEALCDGIAAILKKPVLTSAVIRKVNTETQTHRGRVTRWQNMDGVFAVQHPETLENKHILLVDDVVTTGASLEACGSEILKVDGTTLSIATLAYTV